MPGSENANGRTVAFVTMGCAKNEVDSQNMARRLAGAGYTVCDDPETADAVIVNTCSFIQAATEESIEAILEVADLPSVSSGESHLVVAGCMPARYGKDLQDELPEASAFVPCSREDDIVAVLDGVFGIERLPGDMMTVQTILEEGCVSAYVKISDGCDRFCAYCAIPYIRGRYRSFSREKVFADVERHVNAGVREIVLIAQDTGRWGADFQEPSSLAALVTGLAEAWPHVWFRVLYIQPEGVTDEFVQAVAAHDNLCDYFDIPFQHASRRILKAMNRRGSGKEYLELLQSIRDRIPGVTLRTTLIAGFPGETQEDFDELCAFVEDADLDYVGVFPYSREEGTRAYDLPGQVDEDEKADRAQQLRDLADSLSAMKVSERIGKQMDVLVCGCEEDGQLFGRGMCQAPDVDGVTYVDAGEVGDIVRVLVDGTLLYEMEGTVVS